MKVWLPVGKRISTYCLNGDLYEVISTGPGRSVTRLVFVNCSTCPKN